jgi:DNA-directed RNA polymerase I, II, and III subunit RPABC2
MAQIIDNIENNLKDVIENVGENLLNLDINDDGVIGSDNEEPMDVDDDEDVDGDEEPMDVDDNDDVDGDEEPMDVDDDNNEEPWISEEGMVLSDDSESEDESEDENFEKFNEDVRKNHIVDFHPETLIHNYEEVKMLAIVVRDDNGTIIDELHKTIPILTKYEKTRIIGQRAKQINAGAKPFIKPTKNMITGYLIAKEEVEQKKTPFIIRRPLPNGGSEYWHLKDLEILY